MKYQFVYLNVVTIYIYIFTLCRSCLASFKGWMFAPWPPSDQQFFPHSSLEICSAKWRAGSTRPSLSADGTVWTVPSSIPLKTQRNPMKKLEKSHQSLEIWNCYGFLITMESF